MVAASACESARLLLNSQVDSVSRRLGKFFRRRGALSHRLGGKFGGGYFPHLEKMPPHNHDGVGGMHLYMPWWKFDRKNDFLRGYHIEFGGGAECRVWESSTEYAPNTKATASP